jgi:hypothetical protein
VAAAKVPEISTASSRLSIRFWLRPTRSTLWCRLRSCNRIRRKTTFSSRESATRFGANGDKGIFRKTPEIEIPTRQNPPKSPYLALRVKELSLQFTLTEPTVVWPSPAADIFCPESGNQTAMPFTIARI